MRWGGRCPVENRAPARTRLKITFNIAVSIGNERIRFPVAAKIALQSAGMAAGSGGSPRPVGELSVSRKCTSIGAACAIRNSGNVSKLACTTRPFFDRDLLMQGLGEPVENRALRHVEGRGRIDDVAADVADRPHFVDLDLAVIRHRGLDDLGEIAEMAVIEGDA